jgi:O-antigen ligase
VLYASRGLTCAAFAATFALCLAVGAGDVTDAALLALLHALLLTTIGLGVLVALSQRAWLPHALAWPVAIWLGLLLVSALSAPTDRDEARSVVVRPVSGVLLAWTVHAVTPSPARWRWICIALAVGGLSVAGLGLLEMAGAPPVVAMLAALHDASVPVADVPRLTATLSHPNVAAIVLEMTLPLVAALSLLAAPRWRALALLLLVAQVAALSLTFSRAGILAGAASLVVLALIAARRGARRVLLPVGLAALAGPLGFALAGGLLPQVERRLVAEMEQDGYRATYAAPAVVAAAPEQVLDVSVRVTNASSSEWSALDDSRVALGYHLLRTDGTPIAFDSPATLLPADVPPQGSLDMVARVHAPAAAGLYLVEWDALREGVAWFSWRGSPTAPMRLLVEPIGPRATAPPTEAQVALPHPARVQFWAAAVAMLRDHPVLGVGPDNFRVRFADYSGIAESHIGTHAHSLYLESLADTGLLGLVGLVGVLVGVVRIGWAGLGARRDSDWLWHAALFASLLSWLLHGLLDDFERFWPAHVAFWIVVGLLVRGRRLGQRTDRAE